MLLAALSLDELPPVDDPLGFIASVMFLTTVREGASSAVGSLLALAASVNVHLLVPTTL